MRSLSSNLTTEAAAEQSGWAELLDIYLKESLATPFGTSNVIRISNNGVDVSFFTPMGDPEPSATRGDAATYNAWAFKRRTIKSGSKFANDKLGLAVSNVTAEFADLLDDIDWRGCAVVIRKTAMTIASPTSSDSVTLFSGRIDSARVDLQQVQFVCSSDMATFQDRLPKEDMHTGCRFSFGDDMCTVLRFKAANFQPKTVAVGSTTTRLLASYAGYTDEAVTASSATDKVTLASHTLSNGNRVRFGGTAVPGGVVAGRWYYVVSAAANDFQVALTSGAAAINLTSNGTSVTMTSEKGFTEDAGAKAYIGQAVTVDHTSNQIGLVAHGLLTGDRVRLAATVMPAGLTAGLWYYVGNTSADVFELSLTDGGAAVPFTTNGTAVTIESTAPYGADLVGALSSGDVTPSSEQSGYEGYRLRAGSGGTGWRFASDPSNPSPTVDLRNPHVDFDFGSALNLRLWRFTTSVAQTDWRSVRVVTVCFSDDNVTFHPAASGKLLIQGATGAGLANIGTNVGSHRYWRCQFSNENGSLFLDGVLDKIRAWTTFDGSGTDRVDALSDTIPSSVIVPSNEQTGNEAVYVQHSLSGMWKCNSDAIVVEDIGRYDWGNNEQGYWQIPEAQAGLANPLLKPYVSFDMGSPIAARLWRIKSLEGVERQDIVRVLQFYSSSVSDFSSYNHELNIEIPPTAGAWTDVLIHNVSAAQYWRICVRNTWAEALNFKMMAEVRAHEAGRNWWHNGLVTFAADTTTVALRGVARRVLASASGAVDVVALPATPAAGDRFTIERGCGRTFNECCVRRNEENFGGFTTLPAGTVLR